MEVGDHSDRWGAWRRRLALCLAVLLAGFGAPAAWRSVAAQAIGNSSRLTSPIPVTTGDFGGPGIFQTRTARTQADGLMEVGYSFVNPYKRYYFRLQATPWLSGNFRYTEFRNHLYSEGGLDSGDQSFKDKGADLSFRIWKESKYLPQISLIFQDGLGTGQFSAEHLVASKRYYDLDFSLGAVWGYGASGSTIKNPLVSLSQVFAVRSGGAARGGQFNVTQYFSGQTIALYGGVSYRTPIAGLMLKLEYDGNDFKSEPLGSDILVRSRINYGLEYRPTPWLEASLGYERGDLLTFRLTARTNLHAPGMPKFDDPPPPIKPRSEVDKSLAIKITPASKTIDKASAKRQAAPKRDSARTNRAVDAIFDGLAGEGMEIADFEILNGDANISVVVADVDLSPERIERAARLIFETMPVEFERVSLKVFSVSDRRGRRYSFRRSDLERAAIVDHLFDGLENFGVQLEEIAFSEAAAQITISRSRGAVTPTTAQTARLVLRTLPTPVKVITIIVLDGSHEIERTTVARSQADRDASVDDFFDAFAAQGLEIENIQFGEKSATVQVSVPLAAARALDYVATAQIIDEITPDRIDQMTLVVTRGGVELTRTTMWRATGRRAAGGDFDQPWTVGAVSGDSGDIVRQTDELPRYSTRQKEAIADNLFEALDGENFLPEAMFMEGRKVTVFGTPRAFRQYARSVGRAVRVIANNMPPEIEEIAIVPIWAGVELARVTVMRRDVENAAIYKGSAEEIWANSKIEGPDAGIFLPDSAIRNWRRYPSFRWSLAPHVRSHVGGPDQFLLYQFWASIGAQVDFWRGLSASTNIGRNIYNNFDKITLQSDSRLPKVRSDIKEYLQQGENNIVHLQADYIFSPMKEIYARVSTGYFEEMYGGFSAEILHRPFNSRFAVGLDINKVWQREFDQLFKFREYNILTGHLSLYYDMPWYNLLGSVQIGQYLAGDKGITYNLSRGFDSGVRVGVWATLTNVSAEDFGEGSFDKGFYLSFPYELFLTKSSTRFGSFAFRPVFRDGGQTLHIKKRLYDITNATSRKEVMHDWHRFMD